MISLIALFLMCIGLYVIHKFASSMTSFMKPGGKKYLVYGLLYLLVLISGFIDEIIGKHQFESLCASGDRLVYEAERVRGATVYFHSLPTQKLDKILPMEVIREQWHDAETGELLIHFNEYKAKGGWLSRLIGFPQGTPPLTFKGKCDLTEYLSVFEKLNIKKVDKEIK